MDQNGLYLGRVFDPKQGKSIDKPVLYDPADLTTHAVVVGMTGSGKTGLCIVLLEEAALNGIPALMIDPKGDITNALLHFPTLSPQDFQPWVNLDQARREGKTPEEAASETSNMWRKGLADWGIPPKRIAALQGAVQFAIYTPGSEAGIPINILGSLKAAEIPWEWNREMLLERISSTVTALLALVGIGDVDPVTSREHILLSNIFEQAWSQGRDLDLTELILQIQTPSFSKLGVFDINTFYPEKERFSLAMRLNNILASPAFQVWVEGEPLDIPHLLYDSTGKPRHSVFYIAHLSDAERMFFITLLFTAFETWMRSQAGTTTLRALLYFDEIYGYLPPVANSIPTGVWEYILQNNLTLSQAAKAAGRVLPSDARSLKLLYRPVLLAQAKIRYLERRYNLDFEQTRTVLVANPDRRGMVRWDDFSYDSIGPQVIDQNPAPGARFTSIEAPLSDVKIMKGLEEDFVDWAYRSSQLPLHINQTLKIYSSPSITADEFNRLCSEAARKAGEVEAAKVVADFDAKIASLRAKIQKEELELQMDKSDYDHLKQEEVVRGAETILGILSGRRRTISPTMTKYRQAQKAKADVEESIKSIEVMKNQIAELERSKDQAVREVNDRLNRIANEVIEIKITPSKKDVHLDLFGVAWFPYHVVQVGGESVELRAFGSAK